MAAAIHNQFLTERPRRFAPSAARYIEAIIKSIVIKTANISRAPVLPCAKRTKEIAPAGERTSGLKIRIEALPKRVRDFLMHA